MRQIVPARKLHPRLTAAAFVATYRRQRAGPMIDKARTTPEMVP